MWFSTAMLVYQRVNPWDYRWMFTINGAEIPHRVPALLRLTESLRCRRRDDGMMVEYSNDMFFFFNGIPHSPQFSCFLVDINDIWLALACDIQYLHMRYVIGIGSPLLGAWFYSSPCCRSGRSGRSTVSWCSATPMHWGPHIAALAAEVNYYYKPCNCKVTLVFKMELDYIIL